MLDSGELARRVSQQHITGVTSNPSIFAGAITKSTDYDAEMARMIREGLDPDETYAELITRDIVDACDVLRAVHRESGGADGFVSVEVSPELASDTPATVAEAREWVKRVSRPNLLVKVPATPEGIPAIRRLTGEGISVNVTLIFSLQRYREVMDAYLSGLEDYSAVGGSLREVASVASFFVSRVDTEVDRRLEDDGSAEALALRGRRRSPMPRPPTGTFSRFSPAASGTAWQHKEPASNGPCGPPPPPRTRLIPTPCTLTPWSPPIRSTPCRCPPSKPMPTTALPAPPSSDPKRSPMPGLSWNNWRASESTTRTWWKPWKPKACRSLPTRSGNYRTTSRPNTPSFPDTVTVGMQYAPG